MGKGLYRRERTMRELAQDDNFHESQRQRHGLTKEEYRRQFDAGDPLDQGIIDGNGPR